MSELLSQIGSIFLPELEKYWKVTSSMAGLTVSTALERVPTFVTANHS